MLYTLMSVAYIQVHFRLDFFMEANTMYPDPQEHVTNFFYEKRKHSL